MIALEPQERIHILKRRHRVILFLRLSPFIAVSFFFFIFVLFLFFYKVSWPHFLIEKFPEILTFKLNFIFAFLFSLTLSIFWSLIFLEITKYYFNYWVITDQRIIEIKLIKLFNVYDASVELDKIQDMTVKINGLLPSLFHFGDLTIETAAEKGELVLDQIEDPELVKQIIFEAKIDYQKTKI